MSVFFYCFREREDILRMFEMFSGQRMMTSYIRIGGLALEPPRGWEKMVGKFIRGFPSKVDEYEDLLDANPIWTSRTKGVGFISVEDMLDLGVTGPMLRGAGVKWDVRKAEPYSSYEKFDFEVPTRHGKRCVRAISRASGGNAPERQASSRRPWKGCPRARGRPTRRTWFCPIAKR